MMGLFDYISRNPYQPAKSISKYDKEFLVPTLSRIHTDAILLNQEKHISALTFNKYYHDNEYDLQNCLYQHTKQVLNINLAKPKLAAKDNMSPAPKNSSSKLFLRYNPDFNNDSSKRVRLTDNISAHKTRMYLFNLPLFNSVNSDSEHAMRVRFTQNSSILARKQKPNQNFNHNICTKLDSTLAPQVHLPPNQLALAPEFHTSKSNTLNHNISDCNFDPRVRFTHNKFTPAGHNPLLFNQ